MRALLVRESAAPELRAFYQGRDYRPLWIDADHPAPAARILATRIEAADEDGLDPGALGHIRLADALAKATARSPEALAEAELALSTAYLDYVAGLRRSHEATRLSFIDPGFGAPAPGAAAMLDRIAGAGTSEAALVRATSPNPVYEKLRAAWREYRARWAVLPRIPVPEGPVLGPGASGERTSLLRQRLGLVPAGDFDAELEAVVRRFQAVHGLSPTGEADAATIQALNLGPEPYEAKLLANLERARALPPSSARRFVLVNTASATVSMYEDGRLQDRMPVIVGKASSRTPAMAGLIRHAVLNPYWNVPEDLVRDSIAPQVLRRGVGYFESQHLQALSDWSAQARVLDPAGIDWVAVAAGRVSLRVRQRPGADNMMGSVKFMLPNPLGIYLHDTPLKALFEQPRRRFSNGCVRLSDAQRFGRWLLGPQYRTPSAAADDHRLELAEPVPVYILYLTVEPQAQGAVFLDDLDQRDAPLLAELSRRPGTGLITAKFNPQAPSAKQRG